MILRWPSCPGGGVLQLAEIRRGRQSARDVDWRQRQVLRSKVVDMELGVFGGADGLAVRARRPVYGRRQSEQGRLDRGMLGIG